MRADPETVRFLQILNGWALTPTGRRNRRIGPCGEARYLFLAKLLLNCV